MVVCTMTSMDVNWRFQLLLARNSALLQACQVLVISQTKGHMCHDQNAPSLRVGPGHVFFAFDSGKYGQCLLIRHSSRSGRDARRYPRPAEKVNWAAPAR